jgi:hypothetical protein
MIEKLEKLEYGNPLEEDTCEYCEGVKTELKRHLSCEASQKAKEALDIDTKDISIR